MSASANFKSSSIPNDPPNYLSVGLGYFEHSISPMTEKWKEWTVNQRIIAALIILPIFFFPTLITVGFILPWVILIGAVGYISLFGWSTSYRHAQEAFQERLTGYQSFEELRKKSLELKDRAGNYGTNLLYYGIDSFAIVAHYLLSGLMSAVDYLIELLLNLSRSLNLQKKKIEQNRSVRASPVKLRQTFPAKPIIAQTD
jgi:hypothetical protein